MTHEPFREVAKDDFIDALCEEACSSAAVHHPYLKAFQNGDFPDPQRAIRDFALEYGCYSAAFTRYLNAVIGNLDNERHRKILQHNLAEEHGNAHDVALPPAVLATVEGQPHAQLFRRFQQALNINDAYRRAHPPSAASLQWRDRFARLCESNACAGVGAIGIGTELIVSRIYQQILVGLQQHSKLTLTQRVFFDLHSECDDQHASDLLEIARSLATTPEAREQIAYGARAAIRMRVAFWDAMLERANETSSRHPIASETSPV